MQAIARQRMDACTICPVRKAGRPSCPCRLTLYTCTNAHGTEAVSALETLPHLRTLSLTVHSGWSGDSEDPLADVEVNDWEEWVDLPPMGRLANCVTALTLAGTARWAWV